MRRLLLLLLAAVLVAGCGRDPEPDPARGINRLPEDPYVLPQHDLAGYRSIIQGLRGTPVVVNIWGSWCPPCRKEAPHLSTLSQEFEGQVQFMGVDILDERDAAREFMREFDWTYPSIFDPEGAIRDGLGYVGQPVTIVYDREGVIAFEWNGEITEAQLREQIEGVL